MRRFVIMRKTDVTGVSGTGVVAQGCQFDDGTVVVCWLGERASTVVWRSVEDALHVHSHAASTEFRWLDDEAGLLADLDPAEVWVVPKVPLGAGWCDGHGRVNVMSPNDEGVLTPAEARELAALYLAAADAAAFDGSEASRG